VLAGALLMFVATVVPVEIVGFVVSNSGEAVLAAALVETERFLQTRDGLVAIQPRHNRSSAR